MATIGFWLANLLQPFKWTAASPQAHSGIDKAMSCGSVVTAPISGKVLNAGAKPWGGQVDVLVAPGSLGNGYDQSSPYVLSFLHLSREDVHPGDTVTAGQQLGLSGQPPPGQGYGSGCHLHFEVTHGSTPPYQGQYSPWHPTATSYPVNGQPLLDNLTANGLNLAGANLAAVASTGSGGVGSAAGSIAAGTIPNVATILTNPLTAIAQEFSQIGGLIGAVLPWFADPLRMLKALAGFALIMISLVVTFLPDLAAAGVTAAGVPEAAPLVRGALSASRGPRGVVRSAIGTAGAVQGRRTLARREAAGVKRQQLVEHKKRSDAAVKGGETRRRNKSMGVSRMIVTKGERESLVKGREERYQRTQLQREIEERRRRGEGQGKKFINPLDEPLEP